jgi:hypothetical protein
MNFKTTFFLFGVLIAMLLVFGIAVQVPRGTADQMAIFPSIFETPDLPIETVVLSRKGKEVRLLKTEQGWRLQEPPASQTARADNNKVEQVIDQVQHARKVEDVPVSRDLARYGLEDPALKVTLREKGAGREWTLNVGDRSPEGQYVYVNSSERPRDVMAVQASTIESALAEDPNDLRARTFLDVTESNTDFVSLTEPEAKPKQEVALARTSSGQWEFKVPKAYGAADFAGAPAPKDDPGVKGLLNAIGGLRVESTADFEPLGAHPLNHYGLVKGKETLAIEVERSAGPFGADRDKQVREVLLIGSKVKDQYFARLETDEAVAKISAKKLETVFKVVKAPEILRSRDLAPIEPGAVDVVDVHWGAGLKKALQMRRVDFTLWKLHADGQVYTGNASAIAGDKGSLLTTLRGQGQVQKFFDAASAEEAKKLDTQFGFDNPAAEVKLYVGALETKKAKEETKDKKEKEKDKEAESELKKGAAPEVTLLFGKTDKDQVYVKRVSAKFGESRVAVPASVLEKVTPAEGVLAYLDDSLPSFPAADVTRLELDRGADGKFVLERDPEKGKEKETKGKYPGWHFLEPKELPGGRSTPNQTQVYSVLDTLANLKVMKWVRRLDPKAADSKTVLTEYGLQPPSLSVSVTFKKDGGKAETVVYKFGKEGEVEKQKGVYALREGKDLVFLAQPQAVNTLRQAELRDLTIFAFDATKVKQVKLSGWYESAKYVVELDLERKSAERWEVLKPKGFDVSGQKVGTFVQDLSHLDATQFVQLKGKLLPEYKLGDDEANLKVTVVMADSKTVYTLAVGALNKEKTGYYARASTMPDVVFLVSRSAFEPVVGSYTYFSVGKK